MDGRTDLERWFFYATGEDFDSACRERLVRDLGVNEEGAEVILRMRRELVEMQARLREMEAELRGRRWKGEARHGGWEIIEAQWFELDS